MCIAHIYSSRSDKLASAHLCTPERIRQLFLRIGINGKSTMLDVVPTVTLHNDDAKTIRKVGAAQGEDRSWRRQVLVKLREASLLLSRSAEGSCSKKRLGQL